MSNKIILNPSKLDGVLKIPPSKSMGHRAIICAGLAKGESVIHNIDYSDDMIATIKAMRAIGSDIECFTQKEHGDNYLKINGSNAFLKKEALIDCNESGSTLRFMVPLTLVKDMDVRFIGRGQLGKRPLQLYYDIFDEQGIKYSYKENELNLKINGQLKNTEFKLAGNVSSQFISGLLFALPLLDGDSYITLTSPLESKGYLDLTLSMLKRFGIQIDSIDESHYKINGNQSYQPTDYHVEGDYSQAGFFLVAGALGNKVSIEGLDKNSMQGDKEAIDILKRMNASLIESSEGLSIDCKNKLKATIIDGTHCPDVIPVLAVASSIANGTTIIKNAERLRIKECDRLKAITIELNKLGAKIEETADGLIIEGVESLNGGEVSSWNDHRIAMSLAIASTICNQEVRITNPNCVKKSYPNFWEDFKKLGGNINGS